jgi:hypothetical protein
VVSTETSDNLQQPDEQPYGLPLEKKTYTIMTEDRMVGSLIFNRTTMVYLKQPSAILLRIEAVLRSYASSGMMTS